MRRLAHETYDMEQFFVLGKFLHTGAGTPQNKLCFKNFPARGQ
jgi:hypothetical protein